MKWSLFQWSVNHDEGAAIEVNTEADRG
ncbi:unnamed protein product [Oppiella nova]|uniref:Uncharacterized protein n=1 Tax=Oppiella nova TaxID=334625 RepID=A0A7R9R0L7_9ACAR|nr:unnamed protein product [Oppiella nova]CAG2182622.1 unnamed protein product [Oppiella nova]